jgi:hypothetical protein
VSDKGMLRRIFGPKTYRVKCVRVQVLTVASITFWDTPPCCLVEVGLHSAISRNMSS